jgi:hypothetical protein
MVKVVVQNVEMLVWQLLLEETQCGADSIPQQAGRRQLALILSAGIIIEPPKLD